MNTQIDKTTNNAIRHFGKEFQIDICIEEMSELTKALLKERRNPHPHSIQDIIEEIGDVEIMLLQMKKIYGITEDVLDQFKI